MDKRRSDNIRIICILLSLVCLAMFLIGAGVPNKQNKDSVTYTQTEIDMISAVVMKEVGDCSKESQIAVTNVIINRLKNGGFGDSIYEILHEDGQFESIDNYYDESNKPTQECIDAVIDALTMKDNSLGAIYYCNMDYIDNNEIIEWYESLDFLFELDGQRYYK